MDPDHNTELKKLREKIKEDVINGGGDWEKISSEVKERVKKEYPNGGFHPTLSRFVFLIKP